MDETLKTGGFGKATYRRPVYDIVAVDAPNDMTDTKRSGHNHKLFDLNINMTEYQDNDDHCLNIKTQLNKGGNEKISSEICNTR